MLIRGNELHVVDEGVGAPPLLLVHGFTGSDMDWVDVQPVLATRRRVVSYTHRGHGDSAHADTYSFDGLVADLEAVIDALDLAPLHLLGHSMGGILALRYALAHPGRVRSLILMDTFAEPLSPSPSSWIDGVANTATNDGMGAVLDLMRPFLTGSRPEVAERVEYKITHMDPAAFVTLGRSLGSFPSMLGQLPQLADLPVTVLVGADDTALVPAAGVMHDAIEESHLDVIADAGHSPQEDRPEEWLRVVEAHLARAVEVDEPQGRRR